MEIKSAPLGVKIAYSLGQMGWSLAVFVATQLLNYFYLPPEAQAGSDGSSHTFPVFIYPGLIMGLLTIIGLINGGSRAFDAFIDPYIANLSDRSRSNFGRRKVFMALSFVPLSLFCFLIYYPLTSAESITNAYWLGFCVFMFHIFLSLYATPYTALISELGHNSKDRMLISSLVSLTFALGAAVGNGAFGLQGYFESTGISSVAAFQKVIAIFSVFAAVLMAIPIFFVNEKKYCLPATSEQTAFEAVRWVWNNLNFRYFAISDFFYWIAFTFIQSGLIYYITVLAGLDKSIVSIFTPILLLLTFLLYVPVNMWVTRYGKKKLMSIAFLIFSVAFGLVFFLGKLPLSNYTQLGLILAVVVLPITILSILPNAVVADIADADGKKTGDYKAGIYFGVRTLVMKLGIALGSVAFSSLLTLGKSTTNDMGIRLTGIAAMIFCFISYCFFRFYNENNGVEIEKK